MVFADEDDFAIGERASVRAQIIAPHAKVTLEENAHFRGQLIAASISIAEDATFGPDELFSYGNNQESASKGLSAADLDTPETLTLPTEYELEENYPNPFNPNTTINYALPKAGEVSLAIYNMRGQLVRTLVKGSSPAGRFSVTWNGKDDRGAPVSSGVYVYRLTATEFVSDKKLTLLK